MHAGFIPATRAGLFRWQVARAYGCYCSHGEAERVEAPCAAAVDSLPECLGSIILRFVPRKPRSEGKRMASGHTGNVVPRKGLRVRIPCPPLQPTRSSQVMK